MTEKQKATNKRVLEELKLVRHLNFDCFNAPPRPPASSSPINKGISAERYLYNQFLTIAKNDEKIIVRLLYKISKTKALARINMYSTGKSIVTRSFFTRIKKVEEDWDYDIISPGIEFKLKG